MEASSTHPVSINPTYHNEEDRAHSVRTEESRYGNKEEAPDATGKNSKPTSIQEKGGNENPGSTTAFSQEKGDNERDLTSLSAKKGSDLFSRFLLFLFRVVADCLCAITRSSSFSLTFFLI